MSFRDYSKIPGANTSLGDGTFIGPNMPRNKVRPALQAIAADGAELSEQVVAMQTAVTDLWVPNGTVSAVGSLTLATPSVSDGALVTDAVRGGTFAYRTGNYAARVAADPLRGIYVALASNPTGSTGAWERLTLGGQVSARWYGAVGDATTNDTAAIAAALTAATDALDTGGKMHLVTAFDNPLGKRIVGGGGIVIADSHGGQARLDSYSDDGKVFIGKEYLYRLFLRFKNGGILKGFIYGDSTVATTANGGGYAGAAFEPQALITDFLVRSKGIRNTISLTNRGVGGTKVSDMNAIPDVDTAGGTTDLFIIKYGINDAADGLAGFAANLRSKLAGIRAIAGNYGRVDNLAIVLVGPNATYDPQHGRSSTWYELIRGIYVQAARDYDCAFFDTYAYLRDVSWTAIAAGGQMMDNPFGDGQSVHPKEVMQTMIWGALVDHMFGATEITPYVSDAWVVPTMNAGWIDYGSGFAPAGASMSRDGWVSIRGVVKSGTVALNGAIATLPAYMWPYVAEIFECATATGRCSLRITTSGVIEQHDASANATYTNLSGIRFKVRA